MRYRAGGVRITFEPLRSQMPITGFAATKAFLVREETAW